MYCNTTTAYLPQTGSHKTNTNVFFNKLLNLNQIRQYWGDVVTCDMRNMLWPQVHFPHMLSNGYNNNQNTLYSRLTHRQSVHCHRML